MSTILNKDITRETTIDISGKKIMITLTDDQSINLKLKGVKNDGFTIGIKDLYSILANKDFTPPQGSNENPMISLYDLRASLMVKPLSYDVKLDLDRKVLQLIELKTKK